MQIGGIMKSYVNLYDSRLSFLRVVLSLILLVWSSSTLFAQDFCVSTTQELSTALSTAQANSQNLRHLSGTNLLPIHLPFPS